MSTAGELSTEIDQQKLIDSILNKACEMTGSPDGAVLLYDPERRGLFFASAVGAKAAELLSKWGEPSSQRVPLESSKAGLAFTSGEITHGSDARRDSSHYKGVDEQTGSVSISIVSVPLLSAGKPIGVLQVLNKVGSDGRPAGYDEHDCELLEHLGRLAATAIHKLRLLLTLTAQRGLYSRELSQDLLDHLDEPAKREHMTVLFADLRGFTQLCQSQADPEMTQAIMNDLLTMFADTVLIRGGIVNKFVGDAVFALFRGEKGAKKAARCAFDMLDRFDSLRRRWDGICNEDLAFLDLGIGIATGPVAVGTFGSSLVRDFTAIGTAVNLAAAFEAAARNGRRVLVDNATWVAIQDIVEEGDGPSPFQLGKPGQAVFVNYRHFHLKSLKPDRPVRVFVSHNHRDRDFVERAITEPLARYRIETWYSNADIIPGQKYIQEIESGLLKCDWFFVLVTEHSSASDWVRAEVQTAMRDPRFEHRIVPLTIDATQPIQISNELSQLQALHLKNVAESGDLLYQFLTAREGQLRAATRSV